MLQMLRTPVQIAALVVFALIAAGTPASAALVNWNVDPAQSYVRLNISDQNVSIAGIGSTTIRLRDATSSTSWTDDGGRRAFLGGTISTDYHFGSIAFKSGGHDLYALESGSFRPNPDAFDPGATNASNPDGQYTNSTGAPAAFAARFRSALLTFSDVASFAFRDVQFNLASGAIPIGGGGSFSGGSNTFGIHSALFDFDGMSASGFGQPFADVLHQSIGPYFGTNSAGGSISTLGLGQLTLNVNVPFQINLEGVVLNASYTGQIVAYPIIPEPSSVITAGVAALVLCWAGRRRFRRS